MSEHEDERRRRDADWLTFNAALRSHGIELRPSRGGTAGEFAAIVALLAGCGLLLGILVAVLR